MTRPVLFLVCSLALLAANPGAGRVERQGTNATLLVDNPRPVDSAAITLAEEFGSAISVEDPPYMYKDDVTGLTRGSVPKGGRLEVHFPLGPDGKPLDVPALARSIADAANTQYSFEYRVAVDGDRLTLVPAATRDATGQRIPITPLLDRHVTIPGGVRSIAASANMMAASLSTQTGLKVACCQAGVAGIPWGLSERYFEARDEPARRVLQRLISEAAGNRPDTTYWLQRCDPLPSTWCFINLTHAPIH